MMMMMKSKISLWFLFALLCGRTYKLRVLPVRLSVRLFVSPSVCPVRARNSKIKNVEKSKLVQTFPTARVSGVLIFSWKWQRSRSPDVKNLMKLPHIWRTCLLTGGGTSVGGSGTDCKPGITIAGPNLLSTPETLGNWTDGRILCRLSAPTSFVV